MNRAVPTTVTGAPVFDISALLQKHRSTLAFYRSARGTADRERRRLYEAMRSEWMQANAPRYADFPELFSQHASRAARRIAMALDL